MLDTNTYKTILEKIDSGEIDALKDFLKEEYTKGYIGNPDISALINYCKTYFPEAGYRFVYDGKTVLTTRDSIFYLKSRELVTEYGLITGKELRDISDHALKSYLESIKRSIICKAEYSRVISIEETYTTYSRYPQYRVRSVTDNIGQCIQRDAINFSKAILGEETRFNLRNGKPELFGESEKGKVLIFGIGSTNKQ
ncbi:MAG: hypothetical protein IKZ96_03350 [Bacilli bacterium]|nr:hypothetical protein [Bacilli bacterium]